MTKKNGKYQGKYENAPQTGPCVLFFSGGTALNPISRELKRFTHNSIHLVTPFDSGGSSAALRHAFDMPAVGDARSRMIALAAEEDESIQAVYQLLSQRFSKKGDEAELARLLVQLADGEHQWVKRLMPAQKHIVCDHLGYFCKKMPKGFRLAGASVGNLVLAAAYLVNERSLDLAFKMFADLVGVKGEVLTTVNETSHLGAVLENDDVLIGQHLLTGKEVAPITSPIGNLFLSNSLDRREVVRPSIELSRTQRIGRADLICYAPGSFYSSLIANLLPNGVGKAISQNSCPKIYAPALGNDPEMLGLSIEKSIDKLIEYLRQDAGEFCPVKCLLSHVLLDQRSVECISIEKRNELAQNGVEILVSEVVTQESAPYYDPDKFVSALLSLVR